MPFTIGGDWIPEKEENKKPKRLIKVIKEKRGSSIVTLILYLPLETNELKKLCAQLKQQLGCGGSIKTDQVELQGDKVQFVKDWLQQKGYKVL